jgi:hypothetical protein
MLLITHPLIVLRSRKAGAIPLLTPCHLGMWPDSFTFYISVREFWIDLGEMFQLLKGTAEKSSPNG